MVFVVVIIMSYAYVYFVKICILHFLNVGYMDTEIYVFSNLIAG